MDDIKIRWNFKQTGILPILEAKGETERADSLSEKTIIINALQICEIAEKFGGRLLAREPKKAETKTIMIQFQIIFKREEQIKRFLEYFQN